MKKWAANGWRGTADYGRILTRLSHEDLKSPSSLADLSRELMDHIGSQLNVAAPLAVGASDIFAYVTLKMGLSRPLLIIAMNSGIAK
jgi:hypothetical protein